ncbi:monovalent cation/H(+) antiporter subunit G [Orrella sp. JC864]|uniref:monovalent cation/H(+) antiporter subunit G n=1 Tax=Orrella sp. JC864 TaxID=3120298 RepID=UPI0012BD6CEE
MSAQVETLPLWLAIPVALLLVAGGLLALIGSFGLVRLSNFYQRIHAPTLGATLGCGCVLIASMIYFTATSGRPVIHELLITCFIVLTAPLSAMLLIKVGLYRSGREQRLERRAPGSEQTGYDDSQQPDQAESPGERIG